MVVRLQADSLIARSVCFLERTAVVGSIVLRHPQSLVIFENP